jgi:hypothetical protein
MKYRSWETTKRQPDNPKETSKTFSVTISIIRRLIQNQEVRILNQNRTQIQTFQFTTTQSIYKIILFFGIK